MNKAYEKKYREYVDSLYSKKEQKKYKDYMTRLEATMEKDKWPDSARKKVKDFIGEFLFSDENIRILKKHYNLSPKEFTEIIQKYSLPHPKDHEFIKFMQAGNKSRPKKK